MKGASARNREQRQQPLRPQLRLTLSTETNQMRTLLFALLATTVLSSQAAHAGANIPDYRARVNTIAGNPDQSARNANASMENEQRSPCPRLLPRTSMRARRAAELVSRGHPAAERRPCRLPHTARSFRDIDHIAPRRHILPRPLRASNPTRMSAPHGFSMNLAPGPSDLSKHGTGKRRMA